MLSSRLQSFILDKMFQENELAFKINLYKFMNAKIDKNKISDISPITLIPSEEIKSFFIDYIYSELEGEEQCFDLRSLVKAQMS